MIRINSYTVKLVKEKGRLHDLENKFMKSPEQATKVINEVLDLENETVSHLCMASLNHACEIIGVHVIHKGTITSVAVDPKVCFQHAMLNNAVGVIFFKNNPSGNFAASDGDREATRRLAKAGMILGIEVQDYIIIGRGGHHSLKEEGLFEVIRHEW